MTCVGPRRTAYISTRQSSFRCVERWVWFWGGFVSTQNDRWAEFRCTMLISNLLWIEDDAASASAGVESADRCLYLRCRWSALDRGFLQKSGILPLWGSQFCEMSQPICVVGTYICKNSLRRNTYDWRVYMRKIKPLILTIVFWVYSPWS